MKEISIQELQQHTGQWVRLTERHERIITDGSRPVAALTAIEPSQFPKPLPDREEKISRRSLIATDSADYIFEV